jgi:lipopolysaccharide/colanic/teichoic acid biosynthesis glycosyltransferase
MSFYRAAGKRCFDFCAASAGIVAISPVLLAAAVAVAMTSPGPIFFRQERVGRGGRNFRIFKFRTMYVSRAVSDSLLTATGDARITRAGRWLRSSKIDELAQLFNVVKGDMSLVGPRPEVAKFVATYNYEQRKVLSVRPGVTGPAASMFEEELLAGQADKESFYVKNVLPAKLAIDCAYCDNVTFTGDVRLILSTIAKVARRIGELCRPAAHIPQKQI